MNASNFTAWVLHMKATRNWSKRECARQLGCGVNQIRVWADTGAPAYIGLACAALSFGLPEWQDGTILPKPFPLTPKQPLFEKITEQCD